MDKRKIVILACILSMAAVVWGIEQGIAQTPGIAKPRKSHDVEFIQQRRARRITQAQREAAAARAKGLSAVTVNGTTAPDTGASVNNRGNK